MKLSDLKVGQRAKIKNVEIVNKKLKTHILEMGLVRGTEVKIINIAPMGDPISIDIRGYELGIRKDEAKYIEVEVDRR